MTYAVVRPILWRALRAASDRERVLAAYLLTADVRRPAGLLRLPVALAASDLAWTPRKVEGALAALEASGFLLRDAGAELVFLAAWRDHDALPNCAAACSAGRQLRDHVRETPDSPAVKAALAAFGEEAARLLALAPASDAAAPQLRKLLDSLPRGDGPPHGPPDGPRDRRDMDMGMDMGGDLQPCPSNNAGGGSPSGSPRAPASRAKRARKAEAEAADQPDVPADALRLAELLASLMRANNPKARVPASLTGWAQEIDRCHRIDGYSWQEIEAVLRWSQADDFWRSNILSGATLRKQMGKLVLSMKRGPGKPAPAARPATAAEPSVRELRAVTVGPEGGQA